MSDRKSDFEKINRLHRGPLRLPREITSAQESLRLFMAYLARPATMSALEEVASEKALLGSRANANKVRTTARSLNTFIGVPRSHEDLCRLIAQAPELRLVVSWMRRIGDTSIIPEDAIPTKELIDACLDTYHRWVVALSRVK